MDKKLAQATQSKDTRRSVSGSCAASAEFLKYTPIELTEQDGFLYYFQQYYCMESQNMGPMLGLAGAVATLATFISHRVWIRKPGSQSTFTCPNVYVLVSARSGTGKNTVISLARKLLGPYDLLGLGEYRSDVAIVQHLPDRQARLDIQDEAQNLFKTLSKSRESYQHGIATVLSTLFSSSDSEYSGMSSSGNSQRGRCLQPHVNLLAVGVPGMERYFVEETAAGGFFPRFIYFKQDTREYWINEGENKSSYYFKMMKQHLEMLNEVHPKCVVKKGSPVIRTDSKDDEESIGDMYRPQIIHLDKHVVEAYHHFMVQCKKDNKLSDTDDAIIQRVGDMALKLALIYHASRVDSSSDSIDLKSWWFGLNIAKYSAKNLMHGTLNSEEMSKGFPTFSDRAHHLKKYIQNHSPKGVTKRQMSQNLRMFRHKNDLADLLQELLQVGEITYTIKDNAERGRRGVYIIKD